ncbi:MAG TPA: DUF2752 domain-containing protein [Jatrophihabitans sp.]|nr:DUF2752 domain-containing protein [Jatrophihabitans sp.]
MRPAVARRLLVPRRAATAGATAMGLLGLYLVNPATTHVPLCPLHALTGWWCPLCGSTRALHELLHGRLGAAVHDNVLLVLGLPLLVLIWAQWAGFRRPVRIPASWAWAGVVVAAAFAVIRNLPAGSWLVPPA